MIEQRSPEWFVQRVGRVTGSAVGAILGLSPFMTRADVMRRMVREALGAPSEFTGNIATEYGTRNEAGALFEFKIETGLDVTPAPFVTHDDWLGASPDGYTGDGGLVEVKCPFGQRDANPPIFKTAGDQPHYMAQMQVQMFVTATSHCHFWQWAPRGVHYEIIPYDAGWINENLPVLRQFHAEYLAEMAENIAAGNDAEHLAPKRVEIDTPEAASMVAEWDAIAEQSALLAERKRDLLDSMVSMANGKNATIAGRKLSLTSREGSVAYARIVKEHLPDLDLAKYRGKPSTFWGLR